MNVIFIISNTSHIVIKMLIFHKVIKCTNKKSSIKSSSQLCHTIFHKLELSGEYENKVDIALIIRSILDNTV